MSKIALAGLDGSLRNFGIARMTLDVPTGLLTVDNLFLIKTQKSTVKTVRASSDNLARAQLLAEGCRDYLKNCTAAFVEVPSGGQDYHAVLGFGMVIGVYASLIVPVMEVSPGETKLATVGTRTASKQEMINWGFETYPHAPWRTKNTKAGKVPTLDNEHLADAVAIVHAGINTPAFLQTLSILRRAEQNAA